MILLGILIPLEALASWWQGWLSISFGGLLKQRLLAGSLEIDADKIRHQGVGQLLSRVLESESLEALSLSGGTAAVFSAVELILAAVVMSMGAGATVTLLLFAAWLAVVSIGAVFYARRRKALDDRTQPTDAQPGGKDEWPPDAHRPAAFRAVA